MKNMDNLQKEASCVIAKSTLLLSATMTQRRILVSSWRIPGTYCGMSKGTSMPKLYMQELPFVTEILSCGNDYKRCGSNWGWAFSITCTHTYQL